MRNLMALETHAVHGGTAKSTIIGNAAVYSGTFGLIGGAVVGGALAGTLWGVPAGVVCAIPCAILGFTTGVLVSPFLSFPVAAIIGE